MRLSDDGRVADFVINEKCAAGAGAFVEAMARALFKSWFVDFDPVIDNALAAGNPIPDALAEKAARRRALGDRRKPLPEEARRRP